MRNISIDKYNIMNKHFFCRVFFFFGYNYFEYHLVFKWIAFNFSNWSQILYIHIMCVSACIIYKFCPPSTQILAPPLSRGKWVTSYDFPLNGLYELVEIQNYISKLKLYKFLTDLQFLEVVVFMVIWKFSNSLMVVLLKILPSTHLIQPANNLQSN